MVDVLTRFKLFVLGLLLLNLLLVSCEKFEGSQTIPSYIQVDSFQLVPNPSVELGVLSQNFADVWVYADDQLIGAFELPTQHIPVLLEGSHKLSLYAGIKYNGISGTRGPYPFTEPAEYPEFNLVVDSVINVNPPQVKYYNSTVMVWKEDFETGIIHLEPTVNSDTSLRFESNDPIHPIYGNASGIANLTSDFPILEVTTEDEEHPNGLELPTNSAPVFVEMEYNTDNTLVVGMFITEVGFQITQHPILIINPTGGLWKKIYINLTPTVNANTTADYFKVFIRAEKSNELEQATIILDNIKLLYKDFS